MTVPDETREAPNTIEDDAADSPGRADEVAHDDAMDSGSNDGAAGADDPAEAEALLPSDDAQRFRERWESVQAGFVDKPRETVEEADDLVRDLVQELTAGFVQRRETLERHWNEGDEASTEDLRVALTHYRSFFNRLLSS